MKHLLLTISIFVISFLSAEDLRIGSIAFEGNKSISDEKLQHIIFSAPKGIFNQQTLNDDAARISEAYKSAGILNVKVFLPQIITHNPQNIEVIFVIREDEEPLVKNLELNGNRYISTEKLSAELNFENFPLAELHAKLQAIIDFYAQNGFLFASVTLDSLYRQNNDYFAYVSLQEGGFCKIEEYQFYGNKVTKDQTILKISRLGFAKEISPEILRKAADNVQKKEYIKSCEIIPLNSKQVLFQVEEDRMSVISGLLGYDNSQKDKNKFAGYLNLKLLNLYGTDRSLAIDWKNLANDVSSIELKYHESGWQKYPVAADLALKREEIDSTYINTKFNSEIFWQDLKNKYGLYFGLEEILPGSRRPKVINNTTYRKFGGFWNFSTLDYSRNPTKGIELITKYYYIFNRQANRNVSRQALEFSWGYYKQVINRFIAALNISVNLIEKKELTSLEFFRTGGHNTLRGFEEDQFAGYRILVSNLEWRLLTSLNSRIYLFTDYGYVKNLNYEFSDLLGMGLGMSLQTKLGLLEISYGFSYQSGELRNPLDGIIHFGIESKL